jgi:predicted metal-dependent peptidase
MDTNIAPHASSESPDKDVEAVRARFNPAVNILYTHVPFWALLLENLSIYITRAIPTAAVNATDNVMYINPEFAGTLSNSHLAFLLAHEVAHVALNSVGRRQNRDIEKWNVASDYAINAILRASFGSMPDSGLYSLEYEDKSAEEIFDLLPEQSTSTIFVPQGQGQGMAPNDILLEPLSEDNAGHPLRMSRQQKGTPEGTTTDTKVDWASELTKAMTHAKMQGKVSSDFERKLNGEKDSQIDWRSVLRQKVSQQLSRDGRDDFSYIPPNRRFIYQDIILPSSVGHRKPTLAYCIDTSGSMSSDELTQGIAEIDAIRQLLQARLYFIVCDYDVTTAQWIEPYENIPTLTGGGGTSFIPIFETLEKENIECDAVVVFTDGWGEFPDTDKGYDTIWVITSNVTPPFGECVNTRIPTRCDI